jgi:hypothetical protein
VGLIQIATLLWAIRQNKLFKINLYRSFISPRIFFQDVADRRYYQNGHTILVAALLSGGLGLVLAAWLFAHRHSYALDWLVGRMSQKPECIEWIGFLFWHPFAAILVGWILAFALLWMAVAWLNFVAFLWNRRCTMMQSLNYFTWSNVICLSLLPVGMLSEQLFELGLGWLVMLAALVLVLWSNSRLMNNLKRVYRRSFAVLATTLAAAPLTAALGALIFLEYTRNLSAYWSYFWGTIVK